MTMSTEPRILHGEKIDLNLPEVNLAALLINELRERNQSAHVQIDAETEDGVSAVEMIQRCLSVAKELQARGVTKGDVVLTAFDNCFEYTYVLIGSLYIGAIFSPINPNLSAGDLQHLLRLLSPRVVFSVTRVLDAVRQGVPSDVTVVVPEHNTDWQTFLQHTNFDGFASHANFNGDDTAVIMCSSGTTGAPKGVELSHKTLHSVLAVSGLQALKSTDTPAVHIVVSPGFWGSGFFSTIICIYAHMKHVFMRSFDVERLLRNIEKYQCNMLILSPFHIVHIAKHPNVESYDLSSLFLVSYGGAPLSLAMKERAEKRIQKQLVQMYGLTECLSTVIPGPESAEKPGTTGIAAPNTSIKFVDVSTGKIVGPNTEGEICFKGPNIFKGYYRNPDATANMFDSEGWLHTGDIGYYDKDGYVYVHDRIKELIKQKGIQVIPTDVESVLLTHPDVRDAAVIGIEHDTEQEQAIGFIVKQPGSTVTENDITNFVKDQLPEYKWLNGGVIFVEVIPRTASGKILRRFLRQKARLMRNFPETHLQGPPTVRKVRQYRERQSDSILKCEPRNSHRSKL